MKLEKYWGKDVNVYCIDGEKYMHYHVVGFTPHYENHDPLNNIPDEDSIDIFPIEGERNGIELFESEIVEIEILVASR